MSTTRYELMIRTTVITSKRLASIRLECIFITPLQILCYQNCIKESRIKAGYTV